VVEEFEVRRALTLAGRHQEAVAADEIVILADHYVTRASPSDRLAKKRRTMSDSKNNKQITKGQLHTASRRATRGHPVLVASQASKPHHDCDEGRDHQSDGNRWRKEVQSQNQDLQQARSAPVACPQGTAVHPHKLSLTAMVQWVDWPPPVSGDDSLLLAGRLELVNSASAVFDDVKIVL
jgi:hypothetical protein